MGVILKNTQGLVSTKLTDVGRRKISQGNFNIDYFQIGDSEVNYTAVTDYNFANSMVLEPPFNAHNNAGVPQSTKNNIKYPLYLIGNTGVTYGIPYQASAVDEVFNNTDISGFFQRASEYCYQFLEAGICYNSQYVASQSSFNGLETVTLSSNPCAGSATNPISAGTKVAILMKGNSVASLCNDLPNICVETCQPVLFYNVVSINGLTLTLDRPLPNWGSTPLSLNARFFFYYSSVTNYDYSTPFNYYNDSIINYESVCYPTNGFDTIWNMNIPWSESPAGTTVNNLTYREFGSVDYLGTKEYYGYSSSSGQTDTSGTWYYNSFGERVDVIPEEQKVIGIVHYTNNTIINWYGEKFACEVYDSNDPGATGQARNFQITIPWLSWHKNDFCCSSNLAVVQRPSIFYIDPAGFDDLDLLQPHYIQSSKNSDMNSPGIRYYHLYDTNPISGGGPPNRVGKVFPDDKIIVFDDEEIVAALSYASNRSWTLPAPRLETITPGSCNSDTNGILDDDTECLWVSYLFKPLISNGFIFGGGPQGMHCNYYQKICGPSKNCGSGKQNVTITFGGDFQCMQQNLSYGWRASQFWVIAQKTNTTDRPDPAKWVAIDFTQLLQDNGFRDGTGYIDPDGMTSINFTISQTNYDSGTPYNISNQLDVKLPNDPNQYAINFGDETFFHGSIQTDIQATIYEMRYLINLPSGQFVNSSNPTWSTEITPYMTEIGLFDTDKNLLVLSKFQSPQLRQGIQQLVVKLDF
jgi:hypothetical protein